MFATHLHTHSCYSFMKGFNKPEQIVKAAKKMGYNSIALTDKNGLYGVYEFYSACIKEKIKPIIGTELSIDGSSITVIVKDFKGYQNLCSLITECQLSVDYNDEPQVSFADIDKYKDGLIILSGKIVFEKAAEKKIKEAEIFLKNLMYAANDVYLELFMFNKNDFYTCKTLTKIGDKLGLSCVCTNDVLFIKKSEHKIQNILSAAGHLTTYDRENPDKGYVEQYLKEPWEMDELFEDFPRALANVSYITEQIDLDLPMGKFLYPKVDLNGADSEYSSLWNIAYKGLLDKYIPLTEEAVNRLNYEIDVIHKMGYTGYFLIVYDIVKFARENNIPVVGRGSAGDSLVSYCLGITNVDPIKHNLYFERFLHKERKSPPDIDLDVCWKNRDKLLKYVFNKYGKEKCAMISTFVTYQSRSSFRDVAKAFGISQAEVNKLTKSLPSYGGLEKLDNRMEQISEYADFPADFKEIQGFVNIAKELTDLPRHISVHPCGMVISPDTLYKRIPLQKAAKSVIVTQFDMHSVEAAGLLKMDLLGVRGLSVFFDTFKILLEKGIKLSLDTIPLDNKNTYLLVSKGKTLGCFQIESPAMRGLLCNLKPKNVEGIIMSVAHIRPGPTSGGLKDAFIRRFNGLEKTTYIHPALEPVLKETYGVVVYQEQVLKIANVIAGLSMGESEAIRRSMTKFKGRKGMEKNKDKFISGAINNGFKESVAVDIWDQIVGFAQYGFNKAHSATYGYLGYKSAYLKTHYPVEFMCAVLMNHGGFYHRAVYAEEARRLNIKLLHPDVNLSLEDFSLYNNSILLGLLNVKDISRNTVKRISEQRNINEFKSVFDFVSRVNPDVRELENLIKVNALSFANLKKTEQLLIGRMALKGIDYPDYRCEKDFSLAENIKNELKLLDMAVTENPLKIFLNLPEHVSIFNVSMYAGKDITVLGMVAASRRVVTKKGKYMKFVSLIDGTGIIECVLFPETYKKIGKIIKGEAFLAFYGNVVDDFDKISIIVKSAFVLENNSMKNAVI